MEILCKDCRRGDSSFRQQSIAAFLGKHSPAGAPGTASSTPSSGPTGHGAATAPDDPRVPVPPQAAPHAEEGGGASGLGSTATSSGVDEERVELELEAAVARSEQDWADDRPLPDADAETAGADPSDAPSHAPSEPLLLCSRCRRPMREKGSGAGAVRSKGCPFLTRLQSYKRVAQEKRVQVCQRKPLGWCREGSRG